MSKTYIDIGGDKTITIPALDSAGSAEDLSLLEGYAIRLYYKDGLEEVETFTKNAVSGWDSTNLSTTDEANGNIDIYLQRAVTILGKPDKDVWAQYLVQETDSNYSSSQYRDIGDPKYCFTYRQAGITTTSDVS